MEKILIILCILFIFGCNNSKDHNIQQENNIGEEISSVYTNEPNVESNDQNNYDTVIENKGLIYAGNGKTKQNTYFFTENNACITKEYIIAIVVMVAENDYALEIGSNCYDRSQQGGMTIIPNGLIPIKDNKTLEIFDYVNVYYQLPSDFVPNSYMDYINYSTELEITNEKLDPLK